MMRETWNFTGSIVSDDGAIAHIGNVSGPGTIHGQGYANSTAAAAADALIAGTDVDYGGAYSGAAQAAVTSGLTTEAVLAAAVRRSLSTRMRMGQFDELNVGRGDPWGSTSKLNLGVVDCDEHRALARRAASASAVLLRNYAPGDPLALPIAGLGAGAVVAVLGEGANDTHALVNRYTGTTKNVVTLLAGLQNRAATDGAHVRYSESDVSVAVGASVIVVVVRPELEGESHDRANLTMRSEDADLLLRVQQQQQQQQQQQEQAVVGTPASTSVLHPVRVVVVVLSGGPVDTSEPAQAMGSGGCVTSVIAMWQPGEEGGNALASLLWGDVDFSSALAVTVYRQNATRVLGIDNMSLAGRGYRYGDRALQLFPFGHGLSYTSWGPPSIAWAAGGSGSGGAHTVYASNSSMNVSVVVQVRNTGSRLGSRPLLLFCQRLANHREQNADGDDGDDGDGDDGDDGAIGVDRNDGNTVYQQSERSTGINWPHKWLVAFEKAIDVSPGEERELTLSFGADELARWAANMNPQDGAQARPLATEAVAMAATTDAAADGTRSAAAGGFAVVSGQYALTVIDQLGATAATLTLTVAP